MRISDWSSDVCSSDLVLIILHNPGAGIGWHKDRPVFEHVIGISLGAPASLRLRRRVDGKFERARAPLAPRRIYHLAGEARYEWEHSITAMEETRWSITFRSFSDKGRIAAERGGRSEEHTSELQSLIRTSYAVFCL